VEGYGFLLVAVFAGLKCSKECVHGLHERQSKSGFKILRWG